MNNLKTFEKFLQGYKTYLVSFGWAIYGVLYTGYHTHQWTGLTGAYTYLFSAAGVAALRAALATHSAAVIDAIFASSNASTVVPPAPVSNVPSTLTTEQGTPPTPPLIPVG